MLFNATHPEELRVAIVDGQKLLDLDIESAVRAQKKGNIYKGTITRVEPSLEAAFVEYGAGRQGFLPLKEISRAYFQNYSPSTPMSHVKIEDVVSEGQELVVQVDKDERGNKGAALTTFVSLAGRYLVLMPNNPKGGGISRRISGSERTELRDAMNSLEVPNEHALIARTAGIGRAAEELQWDLDFLVHLWKAIEQAAADRAAPFLIFQESNLIVRALRDYLRGDISEILIDEPGIFERAEKFMKQVMPNSDVRLKLYEDTIPLFSRFQIEHQIETAYSREVRLPSGGALVIDHTEAVVAIDVNSAKATKGGDIEETALQTNLESVDEVARQLRIRDLGGLIVIDLIDMTSSRNQRLVENRLNEALKNDRARVQVGRISRFGLLEMSRQRLRSSISDSNYIACPRCEGTGSIRSVMSSALSLLRILEEEALKENTEAIHAHLPVKTATYLVNEKRLELNQIESRLATTIVIVPSTELDFPHFQIKRLKSEDVDALGTTPSHKIRYEKSDDATDNAIDVYASSESPSINLDDIEGRTPPPAETPAEPTKEGFLARLWQVLKGEPETAAVDDKTDKEKEVKKETQNKGGGNRRSSSNRGGQRNRKNTPQGAQRSGGRRPARKQPRQGGTTGGGEQARRETKREDADSKSQSRENTGPNRKPRGGRNRSGNVKQGDNQKAAENTGEKTSEEPKNRERSTTRTSWNRGGNKGRRGNQTVAKQPTEVNGNVNPGNTKSEPARKTDSVSENPGNTKPVES